MPFTPGITVGPYRIIEQLGQGGMATVYKAYHPSLDRFVAIKVLHQAFLEDPNFQARFQREARLVARLEHPNIVPIYDYAEHEGQPYLVMKYVEGETLKARAQRGPLSPGEIVNVVEAVGAGLAYAHRQGILHRDIKPSNVILAKDGNIYLADFGLARIAQSGESTLTSDMVLGTPQYISPEQAMAKKDLDEGTDIYSFGVMIYELTVGRVPFSADTPFSVIHDHIYAPLPLPSSVNPRISEDLERVLLKALAKERSDRYVDVPALVEAFKQAYASSTATQASRPAPVAAPEMPVAKPSATISSPVTLVAPPQSPAPVAEPASPAPGKPNKASRARWMWAAITVLLMLCFGVVFVAVRNRNAQRPPAPPAQPSVVEPTLPVNVNATVEAALVAAVPTDVVPTLMASDAVMKAAEKVAENPKNPQARLDLAIALYKADQLAPSMMQVDQVMGLRGDNLRVMLDAAKQLSDNDHWIGSAFIYVRLSKMAVSNKQALPDANGLHESVYRAFGRQAASSFIPFTDVDAADPAMGKVARGRYALMIEKTPNLAQKMVDELLADNPFMPDARLLQAEIQIAQGQNQLARGTLQPFIKGDAPEWVKRLALEILNSIP